MESLGLGRKARKILRKTLKEAGMTEALLPTTLKDTEILKSRKGKIGAIKVREFSGVVPNAASKLVKKFEHQMTGGRDDIMEKLEANPELPVTVGRVLDVMRSKPSVSFARAIAEAKADPAVALDAYAKGAMALSKMDVLLSLYKEMPALFKDLMRHAIDAEDVCEICMGLGQVQPRAGINKLSAPCPRCKGSGKVLTSSEHKQFAMQKALEMSQMLPQKGPLVAVQQNQQVNVTDGSGGLLEKMSKMADEVLYHRSPAPVVDAEVLNADQETTD